MLDAPQSLLNDRRSKGLDRSDEMWEGELHMVPSPSESHQAVAAELFLILAPLAKARGMLPRYDPTGLFPHDETYRKLDWYGTVGVAEVLVIEPRTRRGELFANVGAKMLPVEPVVIECLGVRAETVDGTLRLTWDGGTADI